MGYKDAKHKSTYLSNIHTDGGLNYALSPYAIADNELQHARNMIYDPYTGKLVTRPGTLCMSETALPAAITRLHAYEYSAGTEIICSAGGKLYRVSGADFVEIGSLTNATAVPSFLTFNGKLLIADGGQNIRTWNGTTYAALSDGLYATALCTIKGRVVANSASSLDLVTMSGPNDETKWNTSTEGAIGLRAGFGDGMTVNGFAVMGDDLIISKVGSSRKTIYRVNVSDATPTNWYVQKLSDHTCAETHMGIISAFNNVFFLDVNGFKSLRGITEYGDITIDATGAKIDAAIASADACTDLAYIDAYNALWIGLGEIVLACHFIPDRHGSGQPKYAFTDMIFRQGTVNCFLYVAGTILIGASNGHLYYMSNDYSSDQPDQSSVSLPFTSTLQTKAFSIMGDMIDRRMQVDIVPKVAGAAAVIANETILKTFTYPSIGTLLCKATGYLANATELLYASMRERAQRVNVRNRYRDDKISIIIHTTSGRIAVENIAIEMAAVEGQ